ncbi:MAG: beta-hexosaminidase [Oscillospiraceae bacterium]|nr:beta-hexosaminidase [Oscillospiraceae bacterium]
MKKKLLAILLSAVVLTLGGCGDFDLEFSEGEGFFNKTEKSEYTVIDPGKGGEVSEIYVSPDSSENNDIIPENEESYDDELPQAEDFSTEIQENVESTENVYIEETQSENADNTSSDENIFEEENNISTNTVESVENSDDDIADDNNTDSNYNTDSITYTAYKRTADVSRDVKNIVENMTREEKAAQLILARCPSSGAADLMSTYNFAGYTLYAVDFEGRDKASAKEFIGSIKNAAEITPFIAVDEEGGNVVRVSKFTAFRESPFDSIQNVYRNGGMDGIISDTKEKAELLTSLGINMNLAPVADIAQSGDYIYNRTVGAGVDETASVVKQIVSTSGDNGLMSCVKHFPGYGSNVDTHTGIAYDSRSMESFRSTDFVPFKAGISGRYTPAVLVNHNVIECMDSSLPASLSPNVHKILREEIGFDGVIITDDLGMDGIKAYSGNLSPYVLGILSGNDLLCVSEPVTAYNDLVSAMNSGTLSEDIVDEHVKRVLQMKKEYGLI